MFFSIFKKPSSSNSSIINNSFENFPTIDYKVPGEIHWSYNSNFYIYHIDTPERQFTHLSNALRDLLHDHWINSAQHSKTRRGFLDIGGQFLKVLFGTVMDSDVQSMKHQLKFSPNIQIM